ncbi:hypothetical protein FG167_01975 [Lacinutrix sp. WUR7]|uniref:hypothetical protein n=1 Tax=Lacinutrix sp. WUR7 TaxID=2653681 RepID=UPI00193D80DA|nr:hypothetical protein [Lacinutrix sp. WUR7]QRM88040.1 hypothetical protein FG167_01975 [Lacinutrix sp. WUR7]
MEKNIKFISKIILGFSLVLFASCDVIDDDIAAVTAKPIVSLQSASTLELTEIGARTSITLNVSQAIAEPIYLALRTKSGALDMDDYSIHDDVTDFSFVGSNYTGMEASDGLHLGGPVSYAIIIPPYSTEYTFEIEATNDLIFETATENGVLEIVAAASRTAIPVDGALNLNVSVEDFIYCTWLLETSDTYGDGWNGGYVEVISDGITTQYAASDVGPGVIDAFNINIGDGSDYTITYVSGGGTGAGPGWESENYFKLTAPDGTVWEEGTMDYSGIPTAGVITTGTNVCP